MEAAPQQRRFPIAVHTYLWLFFISLGIVPILVTSAVADRLPLRQAYWIAAWTWPVSIAILYLYARHQCSSDRMTFRDGLLWVTSSTMTGWMYQSFFTVLAGLVGAYCAAVFFAFADDLRRNPNYAQERWLQTVRFFYRHRMRQ